MWHGHHTRVAIDTQDNFLYVQNVVVRALTHAAPGYDAIVEECFPAAAMTDPHAFFDAVGDDEKFQRNVAEMMDSCGRFIDFDKIDVVPTSQYVVKAVRGEVGDRFVRSPTSGFIAVLCCGPVERVCASPAFLIYLNSLKSTSTLTNRPVKRSAFSTSATIKALSIEAVTNMPQISSSIS